MSDPTRDQLLANAKRIRAEIIQMHADAWYWNTYTRKPGESRIDADPEGLLASTAEKLDLFLEKEEQSLEAEYLTPSGAWAPCTVVPRRGIGSDSTSGGRVKHKCAIDGCQTMIFRDLLMCPAHWYLVPVPLRRSVNEHWRNGSSAEYLAARTAAIQALSEHHAVRGERSTTGLAAGSVPVL